MRPHQPSKTRLSPKRHDQWRSWVTHARIDENPGIRGHDLCFNKMCQGNRLALRATAGCEEMVRIMTEPWRGVML